MLPGHLPVPKSWACQACGLDWPCPVRIDGFLVEYDQARAALAVLMSATLVQAAKEPVGDTLTGRQLYNRFLAWITWEAPHAGRPPDAPP